MHAIFTVIFFFLVTLPATALGQDHVSDPLGRNSTNRVRTEDSKDQRNIDTAGRRNDSIHADRLRLNWSAFLRHLKSEESAEIIDRESNNDNSLPWFVLLNKSSLLPAPKKGGPVSSAGEDINADITVQLDTRSLYQWVGYYLGEDAQTMRFSDRSDRLQYVEVDTKNSEPGGRITNSAFWIIDARKIMDDEPEILYRGRDPVQSPIWNIFLKIKMNFQGP